MALDAISDARLAQLYPALAEKIRQLAGELSVPIRVVQGLRTVAEQDTLYAQGRTAPGAVVTKARGGQSWHNFGLAVDICPSGDAEKFVPDWNASHPIWKDLVRQGQALGLRSGTAWGDIPHLELTGRYGPKPPAALLTLLNTRGLKAVWDDVFQQKG